MNPNRHHHKPMPINLKSLRTRFALRFIRSLKKIHNNLNQNRNLITTTQIQNPTNIVAQRFHRVKAAADASMAATVGSRRAWSRAILQRTRAAGRSRWVRRRPRKAANRARELRRLIPGGEAMDFQSLLDETAHYVKCLSTQVKVMRCILNSLSPPTR